MYQPTAPLYQCISEAKNGTSSHCLFNNNSDFADSSATSVPVPVPTETKYECPICSNYLLPPIYQCYNGHTVCSSCESKVKRCPSCREDLPAKKIRSLVLEELVVGLKFNCKNQHLGCSVKNLKYSQIIEHAACCLFVEIPYCELLDLNCKERCPASHIITHLVSSHQIVGIDFDCEKKEPVVEVFQHLSESKQKRNRKVCFKPHYLKWQGKVFFIKTNLDAQEKCCSWMVCTAVAGGMENSGNEFSARIKIVSRVSAVNSLEWCGQIGRLHTPFDYNEFTFIVPLKTLELFTPRKDSQGNDSFEWIIQVSLVRRSNNKPSSVSPPSPMMTQLRHNSPRNAAALEMVRENVIQKSTPPPVPSRPLKTRQSHGEVPVLVTEVMDFRKPDIVDMFHRVVLGL